MKKRVIFALLLILAILFGCGKNTAFHNSDKLNIVATIFPPYDFVRAVAGEQCELSLLLPPGAETHTFEPTPKDMAKIRDCDIFIRIGGGTDNWSDGMLEMNTKNMTVITLLDLVETVDIEHVEGMEDEDHDIHDEEDEEKDEHIWTSPANVKLITQAICDVLCDKDSENEAIFKENLASYQAQLDELDNTFKAIVADGVRDIIVFGDRFPFRYFTDAYGLAYFAAFPGCSEQSEPSAATIAFLIDKVKSLHIPIVFHIELSNESIADTICEHTGARKMLFHSGHNLTKKEFDQGLGYVDFMSANAKALKEALK